jgi:hypothetical protein
MSVRLGVGSHSGDVAKACAAIRKPGDVFEFDAYFKRKTPLNVASLSVVLSW